MHIGDITYRIFFCHDDNTLFLFHTLRKKTRATPKADKDLAKKRCRELGISVK